MSIAMKQQTGDTRGLAFSYYGRGKVNIARKNFAAAVGDLKEAIKIHLAMGETLGLGMAYHKLAVLYVAMGQFDLAKETLNKGLDYSTEYHLIMVKFKCYHLFYELFKLENDSVNALKYLELYLTERESVINTQTLKVIENYDLINRMESLRKEDQVKQEKAEIIEKKNHAEQVAQVKQEFLSTMSHEIRTPLNAVITIAGLLGEKIDKDEQELIDALRFASNNLLLLVNDILDFTKLDAGKAKLEHRPVNFRQLLENIKKTYESLAREKGVELNLTIDAALAGFYGIDETKLWQILGNLITNAIKFTDQGSVNVAVDKLNSNPEEDFIRFKISDTGIGIPADSLVDIFESFSQPKSITTKKHGGSGLGLAIVKKLATLHDSVVFVESEEGRGSVFYFDLKLKKEQQPEKVLLKSNGNMHGKTVLLAEDNVINAMVISKVLANWKVTTLVAKNGIEAVEKSKRSVFDFILMDIHMPEMDGLEAAKHILTAANPNCNTPIFALTADVTAENNETYAACFHGFLRKPIELDKLHDALFNSIPATKAGAF